MGGLVRGQRVLTLCFCAAVPSFVWWHHSSSDFEYGNLRGAMYQRRLRKLHEKHNFDAKRFEQLTTLLRRVEVRGLWLVGRHRACKRD